jgi:peroxiredoxin
LPSTITQVHQELKDQGLAVLAVDIREQRETVAAWVKKRDVTVPVFLDQQGTVTRAWNVMYTPTVFLIDRQGRLVGKAVGSKPWMSEQGRALFGALLAR